MSKGSKPCWNPRTLDFPRRAASPACAPAQTTTRLATTLRRTSSGRPSAEPRPSIRHPKKGQP